MLFQWWWDVAFKCAEYPTSNCTNQRMGHSEASCRFQPRKQVTLVSNAAVLQPSRQIQLTPFKLDEMASDIGLFLAADVADLGDTVLLWQVV